MKTRTVIALLAVAAAPVQILHAMEPDLSAAETIAVNRQIATLKSPADRLMAQGWSNAKKVSELLCRPAALPVFKKQAAGVDKVFLGTDAPETLTLESNHRLVGTGQYRTPQGWTDFKFTCDLDTQSGKVTTFQSMISK